MNCTTTCSVSKKTVMADIEVTAKISKLWEGTAVY
jgi:hypothetical protein